MHYLSLCAIVRNEAPYIEEWLKYHKFMGVEKFYLYENGSDDNTYSILNRLKNNYNIELNVIDGAVKQYEAYTDCFVRHRRASRWILYIDADEFVVTLFNLHKFLKPYERYSGLAVHWYLFGSNGWTVQGPEPVVERFTKREASPNPHVKCFVDPTQVRECFTPHLFKVDGTIVDELYRPVKNPVMEEGTCSFIQINHYVTKSLEECTKRRKHARADTGTTREMPQFFHAHDRNDVEDFKARDIWRKIK